MTATEPLDQATLEAVARAIQVFVTNEPEDRWNLPAIQFINNRSDRMARTILDAIGDQDNGDGA